MDPDRTSSTSPTQRADGQFEAIVLAAGRGTRLWPLTRHTPKILLDLGDGSNLLDRQMETLQEAPAIHHVTVVTGHLANKIESRINERWPDLAESRFNPFYSDHGPLGSLWAVRDRLDRRDFLILNGDTLYRPSVLAKAVAAVDHEGITLAASPVDRGSQDDVGVRIDAGRVTGVGKELNSVDHRSAGLLLVRGRGYRKHVLDAIDEMVRDEENLRPTAPWHELINNLIAAGVVVSATSVDDESWAEVDLHPDISLLHDRMAEYLRGQ